MFPFWNVMRQLGHQWWHVIFIFFFVAHTGAPSPAKEPWSMSHMRRCIRTRSWSLRHKYRASYHLKSITLCSGWMAHLPDHKALNKALDAIFSGVDTARHINDPSLFFQQQTPQVCHQHLFDHILQITTGKCCQCQTKTWYYAFAFCKIHYRTNVLILQ